MTRTAPLHRSTPGELKARIEAERSGAAFLIFRDDAGSGTETITAGPQKQAAAVTDAQRRVLVALCRPCAGDLGFAAPTSHQDIAGQLHLTVAAVKTHLRALYHRFEIDQLPQNEKRRRLVQLAFHSGFVTENGFG